MSNLQIFISANVVSDLESPYSIIVVVIVFFFRALFGTFLVVIFVVALSVATVVNLIIFIATAVMICTRSMTKVTITVCAMIVSVHAVSAVKSARNNHITHFTGRNWKGFRIELNV